MSQGVVYSQQYGDKQQEMQMNAYPVVVQPGMGQPVMTHPMNGPPGMMMGPPTNIMIPAGIPPGLAYLASLNEIKIHQIMELAEVLIGWERNNKYEICNSNDQKFMFAKEDTDCCTRQFCGTARPFEMVVTDNNGQPLMLLRRPFRCQASCLWCCCLQEMDIESPPGVLQGTIKQIWTCMTPKYEVYNAQNQCLFTIVGDCCYCKCCTDIIFQVFDGSSEANEVGQIVKHWGGGREIFGGANDFSVKYLTNMDLMKKILLFGATFLIDFNYFEPRGNN